VIRRHRDGHRPAEVMCHAETHAAKYRASC